MSEKVLTVEYLNECRKRLLTDDERYLEWLEEPAEKIFCGKIVKNKFWVAAQKAIKIPIPLLSKDLA